MKTQLIMTVGTNALPVWVAWYHLKDELAQPIEVRFIHTADTEPQKKLLETHCSPASFGRHMRTSPGNPRTVRGDIRGSILKGLDEQTTDLHVHYTGGTQVMGVETVSAIEEILAKNPNVRLDTTYLDARGESGPCLISRSRVIQPDARKGINVDLNHIALLNGFTPAPYNHEYFVKVVNGKEYWQREYRSAPASLDQNQTQQGDTALSRMQAWKDPFINSTNFEYAAYVALKQALESIATPQANRSNYKVYHNVYVKRTGVGIRDKEFELDVVALLGYQIVVVSCTLKTGSAAIKEKGMEVILRARQLGGDEAQAIVLCKACRNNAQQVQRELHDEVGSAGYPLRIWGKDKWRNLQSQFINYLRNDLHWR